MRRAIKSAPLGLFAVACCLASSGAGAVENWPTVKGWQISEVENGCAMSMEYEGAGATRLFFFKSVDGRVGMSVDNIGWSAKAHQEYELTIVLNGKLYAVSATGGDAENGLRHGFMLLLDDDFAADFAKATDIRINLGDVLVDQLTLRGTSVALPVLARCTAHVRATMGAIERNRQRLSHIPVDPFARVPPTATPVAARGSPSSWVTNDDYPPKALQQHQSGVTGYTVSVDSSGRIAECIITRSSGSDALDETTCALIARRARFDPAKDASGNNVAGSFNGEMRWVPPKPGD